MKQLGLISRLPRLALVQAEGAAPLYHLLRRAEAEKKTPREIGLEAVGNPHTLATAIRIGAPASWKKALRELEATNGICEAVSEQEIADAKAVIGLSGIGCEPASAASVAGTRKLVSQGTIRPGDQVVAILTGHILKDPDSILDHQERFGISLETVEPDMDAVTRLLDG